MLITRCIFRGASIPGILNPSSHKGSPCSLALSNQFNCWTNEVFSKASGDKMFRGIDLYEE